MEESGRGERQRVKIDFLGATLLLLANMLFLYAMNELPQLGFRNPMCHLTLSCFRRLHFGSFIMTETRVETPILSLSLFRSRLFTFANLSLLFITSTQSAIQFLMPFYLQSIMGFTPSQMGWIIITNSIVIVMVAPIAGALSDRFGSRLLCTIGTSLVVLAQFLIASLTRSSSVPSIMFPIALSGVGIGDFQFTEPERNSRIGFPGQSGQRPPACRLPRVAWRVLRGRAFDNSFHLWFNHRRVNAVPDAISAELGLLLGRLHGHLQPHRSYHQFFHDPVRSLFRGKRRP